jgi:hypothetical protein
VISIIGGSTSTGTVEVTTGGVVEAGGGTTTGSGAGSVTVGEVGVATLIGAVISGLRNAKMAAITATAAIAPAAADHTGPRVGRVTIPGILSNLTDPLSTARWMP